MRTEIFLLAEAAAGFAGKLFIHGGGVTRLDVPLLPWTHPQLAVVIRLALEEGDEIPGNYEVALRIEDPTGAPLAPRAAFPIQLDELRAAEGEELAVNLALTISPITFGRDGVHRIHLDLNGEEDRVLTLPVVVRRQ